MAAVLDVPAHSTSRPVPMAKAAAYSAPSTRSWSPSPVKTTIRITTTITISARGARHSEGAHQVINSVGPRGRTCEGLREPRERLFTRAFWRGLRLGQPRFHFPGQVRV